MNQPWDPIPDAYGFRLSNPPILQIAAHFASVEIFDRATMTGLRAKSLLLTGYLQFLLEKCIPRSVMEIITPSDPSQRGCQLSLFFHVDVESAFDLMSASGIFVDVRKPNVVRVAPAPLYNSFADVHELVQILDGIASRLGGKK